MIAAVQNHHEICIYRYSTMHTLCNFKTYILNQNLEANFLARIHHTVPVSIYGIGERGGEIYHIRTRGHNRYGVLVWQTILCGYGNIYITDALGMNDEEYLSIGIRISVLIYGRIHHKTDECVSHGG